jgi:hypothetical protein
MFYKIIEDCSPYYIKFTYDGIEDLINFVKTQPLDLDNGRKYDSYIHYFFPLEIGQEIVKQFPLSSKLRFKRKRAALMVMQPGKFMYPHKDSPAELCSFNLPIKVSDEECIVSWYADEEFKDCTVLDSLSLINPEKTYSRRIVPAQYSKKSRIPVMQLRLKLGEFVLFNTTIFHSVDNTTSKNDRVILALRLIEDTEKLVTFEDAKSALFES